MDIETGFLKDYVRIDLHLDRYSRKSKKIIGKEGYYFVKREKLWVLFLDNFPILVVLKETTL